MTKEQLGIQILKEYAHEAAETLIADGFNNWRSHYYGYCWYPNDDCFQEAHTRMERLAACLEKEDIDKIFDEAEECYATSVDPQDWALYKNKAKPAGQPVAGIADDPDPLGIPF